jgi:hypothetical protein
MLPNWFARVREHSCEPERLQKVLVASFVFPKHTVVLQSRF